MPEPPPIPLTRPIPPPSPPLPPQRPPTQRTVRFVRAELHDPYLQCPAATLLVPEGWRIEGGIHWKQNAFYPVSLAARIFDPTGAEALIFHPQMAFTDGVRESNVQMAMIAGPMAASFAGASFAEGADYMGFEVRRRVPGPVEFIRHFLVPRCRPDLAQARPVAAQDLPDVAQAEALKHGPHPGLAAQCTRVRFDGPGPFHEDVVCTLTHIPVPPVTVNWLADCKGYRAAAGALDDAMPLLRAVERSIRPGLRWFDAVMRVGQVMQDGIRQGIANAGRLSRYIARTNDEVSQIIRSSYEDTQRTMDRVHERFDQYVRGVESYGNPFDAGQRVEVPTGYDRAFINPLGEVVVTKDAFFEPARHLPGDWREMRRSP